MDRLRSRLRRILIVRCARYCPDSLHALLAERILRLERHVLVSFLSYRSNHNFSKLMLERRPDILQALYFYPPIKDSSTRASSRLCVAATFARGNRAEIRPRLNVRSGRGCGCELRESDCETLLALLTAEETKSILDEVEVKVLGEISNHLRRLRWASDKDIPPDDYFDEFKNSITLFVDALSNKADHTAVFVLSTMKSLVRSRR